MKNIFRLAAVVWVAAATAMAVDRGAASIDSLSVEGARYDAMDQIGLHAQTEIALATEREDWAILAGVGYADVSPEGGGGGHLWWVSLGIKFYPADLTSLALVGTHGEATGGDHDWEANGVTALVKQRLASADHVLSPFVALSATLQDADASPSGGERYAFTHLILTAELGCDFMLRSDVALVLKAGWSESEDLPGSLDSLADGWIASAALAYYWE